MKILKILLLALVSFTQLYSAQPFDKAQDRQDHRLIVAVKSGDIKVVQELLKDKSININARDEEGWSPLLQASYDGHKEIIELLLDHKADINIQNRFGDTALIWASAIGSKEIVKLLLDYGADINIQNNDGRTALLLASRMREYEGCKEVIELLLTCQKEYLPFRNKKIKERSEELTNILRTSFPKVLIDIVKSYSSNDFMKFSQFVEQIKKKDIIESNIKASQSCNCIIQ